MGVGAHGRSGARAPKLVAWVPKLGFANVIILPPNMEVMIVQH